jgi:hypothetical protein
MGHPEQRAATSAMEILFCFPRMVWAVESGGKRAHRPESLFFEYARDGQLFTVDVDFVAKFKVAYTRGLRTENDTLSIGRDLPLNAPPGPENLCGREIDPCHQDAVSSYRDWPEHHGPQSSHVRSVFDGFNLFEFFLADFLHIKGNSAQRHATIGEREVFSLGDDKDIGTVHFQLVVDIILHFLDKADESDDRGYANE